MRKVSVLAVPIRRSILLCIQKKRKSMKKVILRAEERFRRGSDDKGGESNHKVLIYTEHHSTVYVPSSELGLPRPLSRKRVCPSQGQGVGGHTRLRLRGWGSSNSDDWRTSLALCLNVTHPCYRYTLLVQVTSLFKYLMSTFIVTVYFHLLLIST
jgi:hypothetical protein